MSGSEFEKQRLSERCMPKLGMYSAEGVKGADASRLSNNEDKSVDVAKFMFAVGICVLHSNTLEYVMHNKFVLWLVQHLFLRLAVPFFFLASGYYFATLIASKSDSNHFTIIRLGGVKKYILRLLYPFCFWSFFDTSFSVILKIIEKQHPILEIIVWGIQRLFFSPSGAMWYVSSLIICSFICYLFWNNKRKLIWILAISGYLFGAICNTYYFAIQDISFLDFIVRFYLKVFVTARNFGFVGLIFLLQEFC